MPISTPSLSNAGARISDRDWFSLAWYGQTLVHLCRRSGLDCIDTPDDVPAQLRGLRGVSSGHLVGASSDIAELMASARESVVIGGPCIGDCSRFPTLEAMYDSVQTILLAQALGCPALLYIGDQEEALGAGGGLARWRKLGERVEHWLHGLAAAVGWESIIVVRTSSKEHEEALGAAASVLAKAAGEELDAAFHLGAGEVKTQTEDARQVSRRVVAAHLPSVVVAHLDRPAGEGAPPPLVVMAENLQQAGVFNLARRLGAEQGDQMAFVTHWPGPSQSASSRMYRADSWEKIPAWELETLLNEPIPGLHPYTVEFYGSWLEPAQRGTLVAAARESW